MVLVPAGEFVMGSDDEGTDEKPQRKVYLNAYYIDRREVTVKEYGVFQQATGHRALPGDAATYAPADNHPVVMVNWEDAGRTAGGRGRSCRRRRSGRRRPGARTGGGLPGGTSR